MILVTPTHTPIMMPSLDWVYILGWIDGQIDPVDMPPTIRRLRAQIQYAINGEAN